MYFCTLEYSNTDWLGKVVFRAQSRTYLSYLSQKTKRGWRNEFAIVISLPSRLRANYNIQNPSCVEDQLPLSRDIHDYINFWTRSIEPKFPEISVQNTMDRFGPTGKVSNKLVHLLRWSSFPGRTGWNFGWMDRAINILGTTIDLSPLHAQKNSGSRLIAWLVVIQGPRSGSNLRSGSIFLSLCK